MDLHFFLIEESGKYVQDFFAGVYINTKRCFMSGADIHQLYQHLVMLAFIGITGTEYATAMVTAQSTFVFPMRRCE
jgi:hypothetical protein